MSFPIFRILAVTVLIARAKKKRMFPSLGNSSIIALEVEVGKKVLAKGFFTLSFFPFKTSINHVTPLLFCFTWHESTVQGKKTFFQK